jgi:ABC-type multidrug transport system permease subunit
MGGALVTSKEPITRAGGFMSTVSRITPHAYAVEGYYKVMAEQATFSQVLPEIGVLLVFGVVFFLVAVWRFKFES